MILFINKILNVHTKGNENKFEDIDIKIYQVVFFMLLFQFCNRLF